MSETSLRPTPGFDGMPRRGGPNPAPPPGHPLVAGVARHLMALDVLVAAALTALWLRPLVSDSGDVTPWTVLEYLVAVGASAPVALRRRAPRAVFAVMAGCFAVALVMGGESTGFGVALAAYTILAVDSRMAGLASIVVGYALIVIANLTIPGTTLGGLFFDAITFAMVIAIAELVRTRRAYAEIYAERAARLESERVAVASRAVDEERLRIARELHDVVAHSVTSIAVQSSVGLDRLRTDPDASEQALAAIETSSRTALAEMRRMLGMLRQGDETSASLLPAPGLATVPALVEESTAAGIATSLTVAGERPEQVPPGVDLCGYRIVQEALTNVAKHAPGARADVTVDWTAAGVAVEVADDGHGRALFGPDQPGTHPGHGLLGMRERVALFGGVLAAGPRPEGGFGVRADLPFDTPRTGLLAPLPADPIPSA